MSDVNRSAVDRLQRLDEFTIADLEAIRLILRGDSVIDWRRLDFGSEDEVRRVPPIPRARRPTTS